MKTKIIDYYISERQWATDRLWKATGIVTLSIILWRIAAAHSLQRGLSYALAVASFLFIIATSLTIRHNNRRITHAKQISEQNEQILQQQETARMENVLKHAYKVGFISFFSAFITGIVLLFVFNLAFRKGIALGVLLAGAYGLMIETLSMRQNRAYLRKVKSFRVSTKNPGSYVNLKSLSSIK